jgi:phosphoribosylanthranilate isomerase
VSVGSSPPARSRGLGLNGAHLGEVLGRPLVKICGLTRPEDVILAARLGAWAIGFVFAPSPRQVTPSAARRLALAASPSQSGATWRNGPVTVGVFGDTSPGVVQATVDAVGLQAVQLHGAKPGACAVRRAFAGRARRPLIIQTVVVPAEGGSRESVGDAAAPCREHADLILFDTGSRGRTGGTGRTFPWEVAREAGGEAPFLIAGGITPHNVTKALETSGAWGVDVSSGVEWAPGIKDEARMRELFAAVALVSVSAAGAAGACGNPGAAVPCLSTEHDRELQEGTTS